MFYRPECRHLSQWLWLLLAPTATTTLNSGTDKDFSEIRNPMLSTLLSLFSTNPHQPTTFCHFCYKISGSVRYMFFKALPLLLTYRTPQRFRYSPPQEGEYSAAVKGIGQRYGLCSLRRWVLKFFLTSSVTLGESALVSPSEKWGQ